MILLHASTLHAPKKGGGREEEGGRGKEKGGWKYE
jgi:hypothetical protein